MEPLTDIEITWIRLMLSEWLARNDAQAQALIDQKQTAEGQLQGLIDEDRLSDAGLAVASEALKAVATAAPAESLKTG